MSDCGCFRFAPDDAACRKYGMGAAALRYAELGYAVLPLARGAKKPHRMLGERGGVHHATRDADVIRDWWSLDMAANIGVACGSPSELVVLDLDVKHGADGVGAMAGFLEQYGLPMPLPAVIAVTPSGGAHQWMRVPPGARVPDRPGILPGVDVKGDGGYVAVPPSMLLVHASDRSGAPGGEIPVPYTWSLGCPHEAPPAPDWMGYWLMNAASAGTARADSGFSETDGELDIERLARDGVATGSRNRTVYRLACKMYRERGTGWDASSDVLAVIRRVWETSDHRDFGWSEVMTCVESARRFIERQKVMEDSRNAAFRDWMMRRNT